MVLEGPACCRGADRSALTSPVWVGADATVSSGRPSVRCCLQAGKLIAGLFSRGVASPLPNGTRRRLPLVPKWRPWSQRPSTSRSLALHKTKRKSGQNQAGKLSNIGTTNILRKILKDKKARCGKEEVVPKRLQLRKPIQGFPITRLALSLLGALHRFYCLSHKLGDGPKLIILSYVEQKITGRFSFFSRGLPKGVPNRLTLIPVRNVSPT
ncbi:hypothetical protein Cgig2_000018 [Carnegiea gigantea]|uniref:Uncharacterized protein n=1 Tax=Carnegiea gigantea TaxID=171969 RepID=A0A9Q1QSF1_9CARY|nr:hypothetical protein Cgig2_000018 [Carnegiea gigantea]